MERVLAFGNIQLRTTYRQMTDDGIDAYGGNHRVGVEGSLLQQQLLNIYR